MPLRKFISKKHNTDHNMQITGVGVDLVEVARIEKAIGRWGDHFLKHVFTPVEVEYCRGNTNNGIHFSARFAAKEAVRKAIGGNIGWTDVEITNEEDGKPVVRLAKNNHGQQIFLSMSHTDKYAIAYVIVQCR